MEVESEVIDKNVTYFRRVYGDGDCGLQPSTGALIRKPALIYAPQGRPEPSIAFPVRDNFTIGTKDYFDRVNAEGLGVTDLPAALEWAKLWHQGHGEKTLLTSKVPVTIIRANTPTNYSAGLTLPLQRGDSLSFNLLDLKLDYAELGIDMPVMHKPSRFDRLIRRITRVR